MTELTNLEVGKTYVFKSEDAKESWLNSDEINREVFLHQDVFLIIEIDEDGDGYIEKPNYCVAISKDELKYFKLKEEETMQQPKHIRPEDEVTITTTYGELAKVLMLLSRSNGKCGYDLYRLIKDIFEIKGSVPNLMRIPTIDYIKVEQKWLAALFPEPTPVESPTQRKVREMREQAEELLAKAKELEEEV